MLRKWGKSVILLFVMASVLSLCACQQTSDSSRVKDFLSAQSQYDYLNCEISGMAQHSVVRTYPFEVHIISNRNYQDLHAEFALPGGMNMSYVFDYLDGELHRQYTDSYFPLPDNDMKTLIADTYEKGLHFEVLAENISSLKNISIEEQGDSNIYRFTVPASLLPQLFHCAFDFMDYLIPGRELEKPAEYEMELTADSSHKISNIKMAGDTGGDYPGRDEYDLDIVQLGGTIVVKHDILVPHDYRNIQLFTGYDYEEYRLEGCECAFVNGPVGVQVYLHPRDQLDRLGWSGHIGDYGNNILSKASVVKEQIIESDFQHVIAEYESADGYAAVFGLYDHLSDGFYQVMYLVDSKLIDKYRDEFLKYLKNVVW